MDTLRTPGKLPAPPDSVFASSQSLCAALLALVLISLCIGRYPVTPATALHIVWGLLSGANGSATPLWSDTEFVVVATVRLSRVLAAAIVGASLLLWRSRINLLPLGDDDVRALGLNVGALRWRPGVDDADCCRKETLSALFGVSLSRVLTGAPLSVPSALVQDFCCERLMTTTTAFLSTADVLREVRAD